MIDARTMPVLCAFVATPAAALAQSPSPSTPPSRSPSSSPPDPQSNADAEARRLFDDALAALNDNRTAVAVQLLERARALRPEPPVLYNLALAQRGLGNYVESAEAFEAYLVAAPASSRRLEVQGYLGAIRDSIARIT